MTRESRPSSFEYDVSLSFASEHKATAETLFNLLADRGMEVFLDEYTGAESWRVDVIDHLVNLYARKVRYCVLLISQEFPLEVWTAAERKSAQERALRDAEEYILPLRLDDKHVPGLDEAASYQDLRRLALESVAELLEKKFAESKVQASPPSKSHDLRSGNVPT
jgi:hypothetical protein